jgi:hypothetical protein
MADYKPNRAGMRAYLRSGDYASGLDQVAALIEARAKSNAPVRTGDFRDSIHRERHRGPSRVTVRVVADSEGAVPIERQSNALGRAAG